MRAANDDVEIADAEWRRSGRRNAYQRRMDAKKAERDTLAAKMRALIQKHGIELTDAETLGVW